MKTKKTVVIVGANSGIGRAIVMSFAKRNSRLILTAKDPVSLNKLDKDMKNKSSIKAVCLPADLTDLNSTEELINEIKNHTDKINVFVYVAGIYHNDRKAFYQIDFNRYRKDDILSTYQVGIVAPTILLHRLIPLMTKDSKIITISGTFESGAKGWLPYYVSKKAIEDLTIGLSHELRNRQIQVNCISPSDTLTPSYKKFFPQYANKSQCLGPKDVAEIAQFLASEGAEHITGQIIEVKQKRVKN